MFLIIEKGGNVDEPVCSYPSFKPAATWLVDCGHLFGTEFEVWWVKRFKTKKDEVWLEAEYEVLP